MRTNLDKSLLDIWRCLPRREGNICPFWQDVRAAELIPIMKHMWLMEHHPPGAMIIKFLGSEIVRLVGRDDTGKDFLLTRTNPARRAFTLDIYRATYAAPCATEVTRTLARGGTRTRDMTTVYVPFASEETGHWYLLGCVEFSPITEPDAEAGLSNFTTRTMHAPNFIDLGFGVPQIEPHKPGEAEANH